MLRHICPLSCELGDCRGHPGEIDAAHERERVLVRQERGVGRELHLRGRPRGAGLGQGRPPDPDGHLGLRNRPIVRRTLDPEERNPHWFEHERGGHVPSLEVPDLLLDDLRTFFRSVRT
jgi:hypothetical protein